MCQIMVSGILFSTFWLHRHDHTHRLRQSFDRRSKGDHAAGRSQGRRLSEGLHRQGIGIARATVLNLTVCSISSVTATWLSCGGSTGLGRSLKNLIVLVEDLAGRGVGFRSLSESIDTTTANGKLFFAIMGALAEFERDLIRERTMAGLAAARARGRVGGRPPTMTPEKIKVARQLYDSKEHTVEAIAKMLGVSRKTIYRHLEPAHSPH